MSVTLAAIAEQVLWCLVLDLLQFVVFSRLLRDQVYPHFCHCSPVTDNWCRFRDRGSCTLRRSTSFLV